MKAVGIRELKNRLSEYLRAVRQGERVLITDRGQVIAELRQPSIGPESAELSSLLVREHTVIGLPNTADAYPVQPRRVPEGTGRRIIDELRGER